MKLPGDGGALVEALYGYRDMGFDDVPVRHIVGDHRLMPQSFERLGRHVMPHIRPL